MHNSGKLLILAMLLAGLAAAGASWWFRYTATHRAARFWGPEVIRFIRDAPVVELCQLVPAAPRPAHYSYRPEWDLANGHDISKSPGLTHLRSALLEDRSFRWADESSQPDIPWKWALVFRHDRSFLGPPAGERVILLFSQDWKYVRNDGDFAATAILTCEPIADGLRELLEPLANDHPPGR